MKVYISADIEGTAGIAHWDEAEKGKLGFDAYADRMTKEVVAACQGAIDAGAREIVVKDAHWTGRNIDPDQLPGIVRIIRGWSGVPGGMIQDIDGSFDALIMTGYHDGAASGGQPLAHTMTDKPFQITLNGQPMAEYTINRNLAAIKGVPTVFLSGDQSICQVASAIDPAIHTVETMIGIGASTNSIQPGRAQTLIKDGVRHALTDKDALALPTLEESFEMVLEFMRHEDAYRAGFFPGVRQTGPHKVVFDTTDFFEAVRVLHFILR